MIFVIQLLCFHSSSHRLYFKKSKLHKWNVQAILNNASYDTQINWHFFNALYLTNRKTGFLKLVKVIDVYLFLQTLD